jgi:CheY-like chemotaxis protein
LEDSVTELKVLCVEHHPESMAVLRLILADKGYIVVSAANGLEAVDQLQAQTIAGVLPECDLPDATGASVRTQMKQIKSEVPVLLFDGISKQTPFLLRFFDHYLRHTARPDHSYDDIYT